MLQLELLYMNMNYQVFRVLLFASTVSINSQDRSYLLQDLAWLEIDWVKHQLLPWCHHCRGFCSAELRRSCWQDSVGDSLLLWNFQIPLVCCVSWC